MSTTLRWTEVADRVLVRRYPFFDQNIVAVLGDDATLLVDTRSTPAHAREVATDLAALGVPPVRVVVNTHGHFDHAFGNAIFRPAAAWGHERCVPMLTTGFEAQRSWATRDYPELAEGLAEVVPDPPEHVFATTASLALGSGGRTVELAYLGRGHTDNDIVIRVPDADLLCAGDLLENGAVPFFGDGYPLEWPATADAILGLLTDRTVVVPGHGEHAGRAFVARQAAELGDLAALARRVHEGALDMEAALAVAPFPAASAREPLERALAQLRGDLG